MCPRASRSGELFPQQREAGAITHTAHIDGGARGNPGPAGYGVVIHDASGRKIAELSEDFEHGQEDITVLACRPGSRLVFKTDFRTNGYFIQYDWVMLDNGSTVAGSYRDPTSCGPSAGKAAK